MTTRARSSRAFPPSRTRTPTTRPPSRSSPVTTACSTVTLGRRSAHAESTASIRSCGAASVGRAGVWARTGVGYRATIPRSRALTTSSRSATAPSARSAARTPHRSRIPSVGGCSRSPRAPCRSRSSRSTSSVGTPRLPSAFASDAPATAPPTTIASGGDETQLLADDPRAGGERPQLPSRRRARQVLHPAIGGEHEPLRRHVAQRRAGALRHGLRRLDARVREVDDAEDDRLVAEPLEDGEVQAGLRRLDRELVRRTPGELLEERVVAGLVLDVMRVAEARVQRGGAADAGQRALDRGQRERARP